jgi:hypothetical protein
MNVHMPETVHPKPAPNAEGRRGALKSVGGWSREPDTRTQPFAG